MGWIGLLWIGLVVGVVVCWLYFVGKCLGWVVVLVMGVIGVLFGYYSG